MSRRRKRRSTGTGLHPHGLSENQFAFCQEYLSNGFNARRAYLAVHPSVTAGSADVEANRMLSTPKIRSFLSSRLEATWKGQQMGADEALSRLAIIAKFDVRDLFDSNGELLRPHLWPDSIRGCVKGISIGPQGTKFQFENSGAALRALLEVSGKLQPERHGIDALRAALLADVQRHRPGLPAARSSVVIDVQPAVAPPVVDAVKVEPGER